MPRGLWTFIYTFSLLLVFAVGCSGGGSSLTTPPTDGYDLPGMAERPLATSDGNRISWGFFLLHVNEDHTAIDVEPLRSAHFHINIQPFVEYLFCQDCLRITNIVPSGYGTLLVDIQLIHPFDSSLTDLTGFDVRGTAIFDAEKLFPNTFMPDNITSINASDRVRNADGWTTHFNAEDDGWYEKGKMVAPWLADPIGNLHPFKAYYTDSNRRMFEAGMSDTRMFDIDLPPGAFTFGYSIDASWEPPNVMPPVNLPDDFPITANSVEAFQLSPTIVTNSLTRTGGTAVVEIEVFDWQGPSTINQVLVEAPTLFVGTIPMIPTGLITPYSATYSVTLNNINMNAPTTTGVDILVMAEDTALTVTALDLRAFRIINLPVVDVAPGWRPRGNTFHNVPLGPILPDGIRDFGVGNPQFSSEPGEARIFIKKDSTEEFWRYNDQFNSALIFAGYPGATPSWLLPTARMDVTNRGVMVVTSLSWGQDIQPYFDNYMMSLSNFFFEDGLYNHSWFSVPDLPGNPTDYQERCIDVSNGWGDKFGDPMYALYAYETSASTGSAPSDISILSIREPYNDSISPLPAIRTTIPRGIGPGLVDENSVLAFAIDDTPNGLPPNANLAYILDNDGIEVFEIYFVNLPSVYHGTISTALIPVPGVNPIDIECVPSYQNAIYTGTGAAKSNWIAVLLDSSLTSQFVVGFVEWDVNTDTPVLLDTTLTYPGAALALDVDINDFEVYVWSDAAGITEASIFEYY